MTLAPPVPAGTMRRPKPEKVVRTAEHRRSDGTAIDVLGLDPEVFGLPPNVALVHQVVTAQLAGARAGTQSTRTRAEVRGGGAKPFRQKGTGRARQGSTRSPQWSGGGVALGPKPRSYQQRTPKKMIRLALHCALSDRAAEGRVLVVDTWSFAVPRTKDAVASLDALGLDAGRVLVVLGPDDGIPDRSFANLGRVQTVQRDELNTYDVVRNDWVVFTDATLPGEATVVDQAPAPAPVPRKARAPRKAARPDAEAETVTEPEADGTDTAAEPVTAGEATAEDIPAEDVADDQTEAGEADDDGEES
ncbi:MAG TPA: 50S ribosomal protein L4 [Acidimicrobiales bacterium]|nr:50S ribosomal protein L4 [Acidimicrobiales bacterium]